jgi:alpha-L-fucosidase
MTMQVSPQGLEWFQDARFGLFIHWGLYSLLARGEWVMFHEKIPAPEYELLTRQFNPVKFNADEWASLAADAGCKYIVITSRHHDGFSMYDTALGDYKITNTPFKRDPLKELAEACTRRRDLRLGFYVSLLDWHHPAYRFRKETGKAWFEYVDFLHGQVRELCVNFGEIACVWFDGDWPRASLEGDREHFRPGGSFEYDKLYDMIHTLQPHAVVLNNRHAELLPGEDIQGFEQDLPGGNTAGFNTTIVSGLPLEVCMTINDSWGVNADDHNHKSARRLVHLLARSASAGANYLLNVGPTALGEILPVHAERLRAVGAWLRVNGESIYGARAGIIPPTADGAGVSTRQGDAHYIHLLDYVSDCAKLESVPESIARATLVRDGSPVKLERKNGLTVLTLAPWQRDSFNTVVKLSA